MTCSGSSCQLLQARMAECWQQRTHITSILLESFKGGLAVATKG